MQMSPTLESALTPLWAAQPVLQLGLVGLIWKRKLQRRFPVFFAYLLVQIVNFGVLFPLYSAGSRAYTYAYWVSTTVSLVLGFRIIYEIFCDVLKPYHALRDFGAALFHWASIVVVLIAYVTAMTNPGTGSRFMTIVLLSLEQSVRIMQCALALFLIMFSTYLRISRRHPGFAIALGFGVFAGTKFAVLGLRAMGTMGTDGISVIVAIAYCVSVLLWLAFLYHSEDAKPVIDPQPQTWRWDHSLGELTHPVPAEALMPMFDSIVDRALSKTTDKVPSQNRNSSPEPQPAESDASLAEHGSVFAAAMAVGHRS